MDDLICFEYIDEHGLLVVYPLHTKGELAMLARIKELEEILGLTEISS